MTRVSFCAYPWDLDGVPETADRIVRAGGSSVSLAAAYHGVRAATPWHPRHAFVTGATSAQYVGGAADVWRAAPFRPVVGPPWTAPGSFERARDAARSAGLVVEAWVVVSHVDGVAGTGSASVVDAWGDVVPYALCPSSPATLSYATALVADVARGAQVDTLVLEACGPLGVEHAGLHDKSAGTDLTPGARDALSVCCCSACAERYEERDLDVSTLAALVRRAVTSDGGGDPTSTAADLLGDAAAPVLAVRQAATHALRAATARAAAEEGVERLRHHSSVEPWSTGPFAALPRTNVGVPPTDAVLPAAEVLSLGRSGVDALRQTGRVAGVAAYASALPPRTISELQGWVDSIAETGVDEIVVYHAGLIGRRRWAALAEATRRLS